MKEQGRLLSAEKIYLWFIKGEQYIVLVMQTNEAAKNAIPVADEFFFFVRRDWFWILWTNNCCGNSHMTNNDSINTKIWSQLKPENVLNEPHQLSIDEFEIWFWKCSFEKSGETTSKYKSTELWIRRRTSSCRTCLPGKRS